MKPHLLIRRSVPLIGALAAALLLSPVLASSPALAAGTTYYVATNGSDSNSGLSASTPFLTIQKCADVAVAGDTCQIAAGVYRETVTPAHSGTTGVPITFNATENSVTIDGTNEVTSAWTKYSGDIYEAHVALSGTAAAPYSDTEYPSDSNLWANEIFQGAEGTQIPEAQYPAPSSNPFTQNFITSGFSTTRSTSNSCATPPCTATVTGTLTDNSFPDFGNMAGVVANFAGGWVGLSTSITSGTLSSSNHTLNMSWPESDSQVYPGGGNDNKFRLVGSLAFLTAAGEWYYDAGTQELYMWAANNGVPANIYAKARNYGFALDGISNISVTGIKLFGTSIQTNKGSNNDIFNELNSKYLSQFQTSEYDTSLPFAGIYDANHRFDTGIQLDGNGDELENSTLQYSAGNGVGIENTNNTVHNNLIEDVGYGYTYTSGVDFQPGATGTSVTNNTIFDTGLNAINGNTNLYPNVGYENMTIAYNNIYSWGEIGKYQGAIYFCCNDDLAGTRIDYNVISHPALVGQGMHFDNGTYGPTVDHNLIYALLGNGDINDGGNDINLGGAPAPPAGSNLPYLTAHIYNNTLIGGINDTIFNYFAPASDDANEVVENNILDGVEPSGQNFGYVAGGTPVQKTNLVTEQSDNGTGTNEDFVDASGGNYTLESDSPAINAGTVIAPYTNGYLGSAPDEGAFEFGASTWTAGCSWTGCFGN
jgi:hypothetical protein